MDVTLACSDGSTLDAHKVILSSVSTYFRDILKVGIGQIKDNILKVAMAKLKITSSRWALTKLKITSSAWALAN